MEREVGDELLCRTLSLFRATGRKATEKMKANESVADMAIVSSRIVQGQLVDGVTGLRFIAACQASSTDDGRWITL